MSYVESRFVHCAETILQLPRHQQNLRQFVVRHVYFLSTFVDLDREDSRTSSCRHPVGFPSGFPADAQQKVSWFLRLRSVGLNLGVMLRWILAVYRHIPHLREAFGNTVRWLWVLAVCADALEPDGTS